VIEFPTLADLLNLLAFLGEQPAAIGVLVTAMFLTVLRDWRWSLLALTVQYLLSSWLLTHVFEPDIAPAIAAIKILAWAVACLVLYVTARQVRWGSSRPGAQADAEEPAKARKIVRRLLPTSLLFRLLISLMAATVVLYAVNRGGLALPELPPHINLAALSLMTMGLLGLGLTEEPLTAGMSLLTLLTGFELFYHSLEQAITIIGLLIGIELLIALVTAYLTVAHHMTPQEVDRRRPT
jgi:hypothetical protein